MYHKDELANLKKCLKKTWIPFFGRFGRLNPLQLTVIPHVLAKENVIVSSPAATGKTEAVFAPLVEMLFDGGRINACNGVIILYISPTRALVNNIYLRLRGPLQMCGLRAAIRTGEHHEYSLKNPEPVLFTTPESLDSMLCRCPRIWKDLKAIILDEIHLLDGGYRGDQLRILLERIRQEHVLEPLSYAALSATLYDPEETALRYFHPVISIKSGAPKPLSLHLFSDLEEIIRFIRLKRMHKVLIFTNSRRDAEKLGTQLKELWPKDRIAIHHGSLSKRIREMTERALQEWRWGICVATTTLEIGIDIGDFDCVACYHPPITPSSFQQRIGRGCRREGLIHALGYYKNEEEEACFNLYAGMAKIGEIEPLDYEPDLSVVVQQIFSYLFGHTRGGKRGKLVSLLAPIADPFEIEAILNHLIDLGFIKYQREQYLATENLMNMAERGIIHSNIPSHKEYRIIDKDSGAQIGEIGIQAVPGTVFTLGGKVWETVSIKGLNLYAKVIARKPKLKHFCKKKPSGAFARFLPEFLKKPDMQGY